LPPDDVTVDERLDVLVVDDDEAIRALASLTLKNAGFTVETAEDGRQAFRVLQRTRPRVVLLDMAMPVMNGWGALEYIRVSPELRSVPVVMMSANTEAFSPIRSDGFLQKPFSKEALLFTLRPFVGTGSP
jgi:two-component system chemotaxis response regulator CheY